MNFDGALGRAPGAVTPGEIARQVRISPTATAIEAPCGAITYAELEARAGLMAARLAATGVGQGDLVAVCLPRSFDQITAMLAAWWLGAAYLPLDPAWPQARLAALVARAGARALVSDAAAGAAIAGTTAVIDPRLPAAATPAPRAKLAPDNIAYVIYTSGSTGAPKGVEVTHANLAALIDWHCDAFALAPCTRTSHLAGLGFDAAAWEVWPTLAAGGTLVLVDEAARTEPERLRDWLVALGIEIAFAPTALAQPLARMAWPAGTALRQLLTGADKLTLRPTPGQPFKLINNYGPTESTVVATSGVVLPEGEALPSIGSPIAGITIHILNDAGEPVPPGETGEIWIGGRQVARGYRGDAAATDERFVSHPLHGRLYRTGDLGVWQADGEIGFRGRRDDQVKIRGHRVEPAEVTAALQLVPGIASAAVVSRDGELVAYVVLAAGAELTASGLRAALATSLPDYLVPARFARIDILPLTANGKLDAKALPDPASCPLAEAQASRAPASPAEKRLFEIISSVIGRSDFGVEDDFFLLGGHSLLGTQVIIRARDAFGVELNLFHLFEGRTVAALALKVEELVIEKLSALSDDDIRRMSAA